ncbi:energy-coupling factor ABC transporter permease [Vibrio sp.]|uniref:energy-coupling factor ABC transporter permease n=1 Tax=Vibrio sp. TaxID=678 RepID=UPI00311FF36C
MQLSELCFLTIILLSIKWVWEDISLNLIPKLRLELSFQHITCGAIVLLGLLWSTQASVKDNLTIHFLALTSLTLMYGWRSACGLTIVIAISLSFFGQIEPYKLPSYIVLSCFLPVMISYSIFLLSYSYLPRNIFVFIFVAGFFNGAFTGSLHLLMNAIYLLSIGAYDWATISDNYLIFLPLLAFPEGLLNGMTVAILVVFKPEWLRVFSDRDYIYNHYRDK